MNNSHDENPFKGKKQPDPAGTLLKKNEETPDTWEYKKKFNQDLFEVNLKAAEKRKLDLIGFLHETWKKQLEKASELYSKLVKDITEQVESFLKSWSQYQQLASENLKILMASQALQSLQRQMNEFIEKLNRQIGIILNENIRLNNEIITFQSSLNKIRHDYVNIMKRIYTHDIDLGEETNITITGENGKSIGIGQVQIREIVNRRNDKIISGTVSIADSDIALRKEVRNFIDEKSRENNVVLAPNVAEKEAIKVEDAISQHRMKFSEYTAAIAQHIRSRILYFFRATAKFQTRS